MECYILGQSTQEFGEPKNHLGNSLKHRYTMFTAPKLEGFLEECMLVPKLFK